MNYSEAPEDDWEWQTELSQWLGESEAGLSTSGTSLSTVRLPGTAEGGSVKPQTCSAGVPPDLRVQGPTLTPTLPLPVPEALPEPVPQLQPLLQQQQQQQQQQSALPLR